MPSTPGDQAPVVLLAHAPHPAAGAAFEAALRQAYCRAARLVIVNATRGESLVDPQFASFADLKGFVQRAQEVGVIAEAEQPVGPDVATMILNRAYALPAELIVLGTRHRSTVGKLIMGSTAQRVLMEAECEVLLVKGTSNGGGAVADPGRPTTS